MTRATPAAWAGRAIRAVLFDLDGTLLDTAADIARALNRSLQERGWEPFAVSAVARMIGRGAPMLIERAAEARRYKLTATQQNDLLERFFVHYGSLEETHESEAVPYAGASQALERLHSSGMRIAVVTNKQRRFADELLHRLGLSQWVDTLVGGDTCERRKPDPQPLLHACVTLAIPSDAALMVGDSINDVTAARAAGMPVICVPYGYNEGQDPRSLACDALVDTLADIPEMLWKDG